MSNKPKLGRQQTHKKLYNNVIYMKINSDINAERKDNPF